MLHRIPPGFLWRVQNLSAQSVPLMVGFQAQNHLGSRYGSLSCFTCVLLPKSFYEIWRQHQHLPMFHNIPRPDGDNHVSHIHEVSASSFYHDAIHTLCHHGNSSSVIPPPWSWELWFIVGPPNSTNQSVGSSQSGFPPPGCAKSVSVVKAYCVPPPLSRELWFILGPHLFCHFMAGRCRP